MNPNPPVQNPGQDLQQLLIYLEKFGFKFFGFNENKKPMVTAPNGQVVSIDMAYQFVQSKLIAPTKTGGSSQEAIPNVPTESIPDFEASKEQFDSKVEQPKEVEKGQDNAANVEKASEQAQQDDTKVQNVAPKVAIKDIKVDLPFEGYYPKAFDPTDIVAAQNFVATNVTKSNANTAKWLATMWEKFISEANL